MAMFLGVGLPLVQNRSSGYDMINDFTALTDQNLKMLVLTCPGETWNAEYGVGLRNYLFEMVHPSVFETFKTELLRQQSIYIPYIRITNVEFRSQLTNPNLPPNYLGISITYFSEIDRRNHSTEIPGALNLI